MFLILVWKLFVFRLIISSVYIGIQVWQCWYWYRVIFAIDVITVGVCDCAIAISISININISINIIRVCYQMMEITKLCVIFRFICIKIHVFYNSIDMIPIINSLWAVIKHNIFLFLLQFLFFPVFFLFSFFLSLFLLFPVFLFVLIFTGLLDLIPCLTWIITVTILSSVLGNLL